MKTDEKSPSKMIRKIVFISIIFIFLLTMGVMATKSDVNHVTIVFPEGYESTVVTTKAIVSDILSENHVLVLPDEKVYPGIDSKIDNTRKITISKITKENKVIAEKIENVTTEEILGKYVTVTEKIIIEQVIIPYETVTKDVSKQGTETKDSVIQQGVDGLKEIKYKVKYQEEKEIERTIILENIIKEPIDKIIQISTKITARSKERGLPYPPEVIKASVEGMTPEVRTLNTSAYCPCLRCCGKTNGITSSGTKASAWHTVAAGPGYPVGTVIYIPALADKPNGGWFVVEDRGGAISNNRIDIFMNNHSQAILFGRRNLQCYIYK